MIQTIQKYTLGLFDVRQNAVLILGNIVKVNAEVSG
jgi:hypothetical protein